MAAASIYLVQSQVVRTTGCVICAASAVVAFALVVRPANLIIVLAWYLALSAALIVAPQWKDARGKLLGISVAGLFASAVIFWGPQIAYSYRSLGELAVLPVCSLSGLQKAASIPLLRYDTLMTGGKAGPLFYLNPMFTGDITYSGALNWYLGNPSKGLFTALAHIFNSFNVTTLFTYLWEKPTGYSFFLRLLYWSVTVLAVAGIFREVSLTVFDNVRIKTTRKYVLPISFVFLSVAGDIALNSITAVELRFNAVPLAVLSVVALWKLGGLVARRKLPALAPALLMIAAVGLCMMGSYAMDRFASEKLEGRSIIADTPGSQCFMTTKDQGKTREEIIAAYNAEMMRRQ